jgi:hypothetical protein
MPHKSLLEEIFGKSTATGRLATPRANLAETLPVASQSQLDTLDDEDDNEVDWPDTQQVVSQITEPLLS